MNLFLNFFSINNILFTIFNYQMSYIELIGTIFYLWSVWLIANKKILTWPVGIVSVILYAVLFYQIKLYGDCIEQLYYLGASVYGWLYWIKHGNKSEDNLINIRFSSKIFIYISIIITLIISIIFGFFISKVHMIFPLIFTEKASFPFIDALTTIMSFTAMFLLAQKRIESWIYWIIVDIIGVVLYFIKDVKFISLLYIVLLVLAAKGLISWIITYKKYNLKNK